MTKAFNCAVGLLTRREHGMRELADKLVQKGFNPEESSNAITECQRLGLQSDERFVENFCNSRIRQGYGPLRIRQELQMKRIDQDLITSILGQYQDSWDENALNVWQKKFKGKDNPDISELNKQKRFLLYRGFSSEIITRLFKNF